MNTDQSTSATPEAVCSTAMLGPLPEADVTALSDYFDAAGQRHSMAYSVDAVRALLAAERERCAVLCRRVADETRNSEDARAAGRMLANWISTGDPNDPRPNDQLEPLPQAVGSKRQFGL